jgi:hypothetical protein
VRTAGAVIEAPTGHPRAATITGILAGLAANYWVLESLFADRTDPAGGWVSDLGARSESTGWIFDLLDAGSGLILLAFALLLRPLVAGRGSLLRYGLVALIVVGACSIVDGAFPLSCAESLPGPCELSYDWIDVVHVGETFVATAAMITAFGCFSIGLLGEADARPRRLGALTAVAGVLWVACNLVMAASYPIDGLDHVRGAFHRGSQVALGAWLIALAVGVGSIGARDSGSRVRAAI